MKKVIALLAGGTSSEYVISVKSAEQVSQLINSSGYISYTVVVKGWNWKAIVEDGKETDVDMNDFSFMTAAGRIRPDFAYIMIHGTPGEDGKIQALLDMLKIRYNTGGVLSSALTFNKYVCKMYLKNSGILTAESMLITKESQPEPADITHKLGLPCFVKPNSGGSSFGTSRVNAIGDLQEAIRNAFAEDDEVLIESFIGGTELTCGIFKTSEEEILFPVTEVVSKKEFFDFEAKYTEGMAEEITPARIPDEVTKRCQQLSSDIYDLTFCRGLVRVDFILREGDLYFLEINTVPGMSRESIIPKQIRALGLTESEVINKIIGEMANS